MIIINTTFTCIDDYYIAIPSQKGISCSKSVAGLLPCHHQANIMMRSHHLLAFDDHNSSLLQVVNGLDINIIETFVHKLSTTCGQSAHIKLQCTSLIFVNLLQLDEVNRLAATCWQLAASWYNPQVPQLAASLWHFWLCMLCTHYLANRGRTRSIIGGGGTYSYTRVHRL